MFDCQLTKKEFLFSTAWSLFIISVLMELTAWQALYSSGWLGKILQLMRYSAYFICCIIIIENTFKRELLIGLLAVGMCFSLGMLCSANKTMVLYFLLIMAASGLRSSFVLKISFIIQTVIFSMTILCSQIGLAVDFDFSSEMRVRHGLGFAWTTTGSILFFYMVLQYVYLRKRNASIIEYVILEAVNYLLYRFTDSRMAFLLTTLYLLFFCMERLFRHPWKISEKAGHLFCIVPTIISLGSLLAFRFYREGSSVWDKLNSVLSDRLALGSRAIHQYGYTLFGQKIKWVGYSVQNPQMTVDYNYVDCSYLQLALEYGLIFLCIVIIFYTIILFKAVKSRDYYLVWTVLFVMGLSITEPRLMQFAFNPFPILLLCRFHVSMEKKKKIQLRGSMSV